MSRNCINDSAVLYTFALFKRGLFIEFVQNFLLRKSFNLNELTEKLNYIHNFERIWKMITYLRTTW